MDKYGKISKEIDSLEGSRVLGTIKSKKGDYPFYQVKMGKGEKVLISGGVHGDEPAGIYAVLHFLKHNAQKYLNNFEFIAYPCVNPSGFENNSRKNEKGLNINREFKPSTKSEEVNLILGSLESYLFAMDFHETWYEDPTGRNELEEPVGLDPTEFYLWETCGDKSKRVGHKIIHNIEQQNIPVCKWPKIYDDINTGGVIWYPEGCGTKCYLAGTNFDSYLCNNHTDQSFVIETFKEWKLKDRVNAHIIALETTLDEKLKSR